MHRVHIVERFATLSYEIWVHRNGPPGQVEVLTNGGEWVAVPQGARPDVEPSLLIPIDALDQLADEIARIRGTHKSPDRLEGQLGAVEDALTLERARVEKLIDKMLT